MILKMQSNISAFYNKSSHKEVQLIQRNVKKYNMPHTSCQKYCNEAIYGQSKCSSKHKLPKKMQVTAGVILTDIIVCKYVLTDLSKIKTKLDIAISNRYAVNATYTKAS